MKIPKNMTKEEVVETIQKVIKRVSHNFKFAFYDVEDIEQEAFIIGMEALERYDESKPLENFLFVHMANRLKNFKRDNYFRQDEGNAEKVQKRKKNLLEPANLENFSVAREEEDLLSKISNSEIMELVKRSMPSAMRSDYLRLCAGVSISKNRKSEIEAIIREIIEDE